MFQKEYEAIRDVRRLQASLRDGCFAVIDSGVARADSWNVLFAVKRGKDKRRCELHEGQPMIDFEPYWLVFNSLVHRSRNLNLGIDQIHRRMPRIPATQGQAFPAAVFLDQLNLRMVHYDRGVDPTTSPANHSPQYEVDEGVLPLGVRTLANLAADFLSR